MPKFLKLFFLITSLVVTLALLKNVLSGRAYATTRGIIKLSGVVDANELGKHTYRQIYGVFLEADKVVLAGNTTEGFAKDFFTGASDEARRLDHKSWSFSEGSELDLIGANQMGFVQAPNYFRLSRFNKQIVLPKTSLVFYFGKLIHPKDQQALPEKCELKEHLFDYDCVQIRVSFKAAEKWDRIKSCKKATVDQTEMGEFLVLYNDDDCYSDEPIL